MLQQIYNELKAVFEADATTSASAFQPSPKSDGLQTVFVARDGDGVWYTLDDNGDKSFIDNSSYLYGAVTKVDDAMSNPSSSKYKPKRKLKVYVQGTDGVNYMLYCGFDTAFGKSLIKGLNAFAPNQFAKLAIGLTLSDQDEKVVFANILTQDGRWEKADNSSPIESQYASLRAKLGQGSGPQPVTTGPVPVKSVVPSNKEPNKTPAVEMDDIPF